MPVEIADTTERPPLDRPAEVHLRRCPPAETAVRPIPVVEGLEVRREAIQLPVRSYQPGRPEDGLLESTKESLDAAVGPGMGDSGAGMLDTVSLEDGYHGLRTKTGVVVGQ